jgi:hypothetical protein
VSKDCDPYFAMDEKLWRRFRASDANGSKGAKVALKPTSLRMQLSVNRESLGTLNSVADAERTGVAQAEACAVARVHQPPLRCVCVHEPMRDNPAHTLIAMVAEPGAARCDIQVNDLRFDLASCFQIVLQPTK